MHIISYICYLFIYCLKKFIIYKTFNINKIYISKYIHCIYINTKTKKLNQGPFSPTVSWALLDFRSELIVIYRNVYVKININYQQFHHIISPHIVLYLCDFASQFIEFFLDSSYYCVLSLERSETQVKYESSLIND